MSAVVLPMGNKSVPARTGHLPSVLAFIACSWLVLGSAPAQSIRSPWSGYGHDSQHGDISAVAAQPLNRILWQTPVDLNPQYSGNDLLIHYGSPLVTRSNTVIVPVKVGATSGFQVEGRTGTNGVLKWLQSTDYRLPPHNWVPSFSPTLTPNSRLYFPGGGGTVYFRDSPDAVSGATGQLAFYCLANYNANTNAYLASVMINTPITSDRYGNIYFGFQVTNATPVALTSGVARIDSNGYGTWISAAAASTDATITKVVHNCAPALSNDHKTLYVAVNTGNFGSGYLLALDSRTLTPLAKVRLKDANSPATDARLPDDGTASPTVGPDGDVYFGVFGNPNSNHSRGWLLHFNGTLTQTSAAGAFGWDDTASVVPASMVPSYHGSSSYLLMTKYNNYVSAGGDGINKIAILDPHATMTDPISGAIVMKDVLTIAGPTPDDEFPGFPGAVREWCINTAAVDPFTKSILVNNEDGKLYRWDLTSNSLIQPVTLTAGIGEAYTPTLIGVDGIVYAINNGILFAVGK